MKLDYNQRKIFPWSIVLSNWVVEMICRCKRRNMYTPQIVFWIYRWFSNNKYIYMKLSVALYIYDLLFTRWRNIQGIVRHLFPLRGLQGPFSHLLYKKSFANLEGTKKNYISPTEPKIWKLFTQQFLYPYTNFLTTNKQ